MCRYGFHSYKSRYACFYCRKAFKQDSQHKPGCPQCTRPLKAMGMDFKPPSQQNLRQWKKVEILFQHGFAYHSCGCGGPGYRPRYLSEVQDFLATQLSHTENEGQILLQKIEARALS